MNYNVRKLACCVLGNYLAERLLPLTSLTWHHWPVWPDIWQATTVVPEAHCYWYDSWDQWNRVCVKSDTIDYWL